MPDEDTAEESNRTDRDAPADRDPDYEYREAGARNRGRTHRECPMKLLRVFFVWHLAYRHPRIGISVSLNSWRRVPLPELHVHLRDLKNRKYELLKSTPTWIGYRMFIPSTTD